MSRYARAARAPGGAGLSGCSSFKLRQLSRRVSQIYDAELARSGLKTTQYSLLSTVVRQGPLPPGRLAALLQMDASTLTRNLRPLIAQGWLRLGPGEDGRSRLVHATPAGVDKRAQAKCAWKRAQLGFNARLGEPLVGRLHTLIDQCLEGLQE